MVKLLKRMFGPRMPQFTPLELRGMILAQWPEELVTVHRGYYELSWRGQGWYRHHRTEKWRR
jgi:hypothetical protein